MRPRILRQGWFAALVLLNAGIGFASEPATRDFSLENGNVACHVRIIHGVLSGDRLDGKVAWLRADGQRGPVSVSTDAGFGVDVMFTGWRAPGKENNADNPVLLGPRNFVFVSGADTTEANGTRILTLYFKGVGHTIDLCVEYRLDRGSPTLRSRIAVRDTAFGKHFLRWLWPRRGSVSGIRSVVDAGSFGQPVAVRLSEGGVFFGLEFPSAENRLDDADTLRCGQEVGGRIQGDWISSEWVAEGLTPDRDVKRWFFEYLDGIRVAPLRPYTLYNSWYDLRSPEYPHVPPENVMSESSAMKMVDLLRENMVDKHGIALDAFVLDDGWDDYDSDWVPRKEQWPNGLHPLAERLAATHTTLGLWFGPIGGYSFRNRRIAWMKSHGYEVVGDELCVAGKNYSALLRKRTTDFAKNDGVGYYKWDGIQFSCSEPDHGHPVGIYSRRAVLNAVIAMCRSVRHVNPSMFLNITSGTWLSPWWLKYANTIWMDGEDYGYADVPSISKRDAAITYRDFVLYQDFHLKKLWFPMANLMTHGIIKGKLELLGSPEEPLDKFTDDLLLYVARGVSMYELYISPDIMTDGEWTSIALSIAWAKDRFSTLMHTAMIGGNPLRREAYGYAHLQGNRGVLALRNPVVDVQKLRVGLATADGLDRNAKDLVLERVYPTRWVAPHLFRTGDSLTLALGAFETAVYELYPLSEGHDPLLAGAVFTQEAGPGHSVVLRVQPDGEEIRILNPGTVTSISVDGHEAGATNGSIRFPRHSTAPLVSHTGLHAEGGTVACSLELSHQATQATVGLLLAPAENEKNASPPRVSAEVEGTPVAVSQGNTEGRSRWFLVPFPARATHVRFHIAGTSGAWKGTASVCVVAMEKPSSHEVRLTLRQPPGTRVLPPQPWAHGEIRRTVKIGDVRIFVSQ